MPFYINLAFKNIFRQKRRSFTLGANFLFISLILTLLFSFSAGVKKNISENIITSAAGHLSIAGDTVVKGKTLPGITDSPSINQAVLSKWPDARIITRYYISSAVYYQGLSKRVSFTGIDSQSDLSYRDQLDIYDGSWQDFVDQENSILMPRDVAEYFEVKSGDEILVSTRSRYGAFNTANFQVKGVYDSANYFVQGITIAHFGFLQKLDLAEAGSASNVFVYFKDGKDFDAKRETLMPLLTAKDFKVTKPDSSGGGISVIAAASPQYKLVSADVNEKRLTIATVDEVLAILSQILATVNLLGVFIAAILLFIIAISIFINMRMSINDRIQEIGTLRAMGTEKSHVIKLFVMENVFLSLVFTLIGIAVAMVVIAIFSWAIVLPPKGVVSLVLNQGHLVFDPSLGSLLFIVAVVCGFTAFFSWFPARKGGSIGPAEALSRTF